MGGYQTLLVLGSIVLLSLLALTVHRTVLSSSDSIYDAESIIEANNAAQQIVSDIITKDFDEAVVNGSATDESSFSVSLGPEAGETLSTYDDVDDYNNSLTSVQQPSEVFQTSVKVNYVSPGTPDNISAARTRIKRILVNVYSNALPDTVKMYYYSSY